jgi:hypothetical protein
MWRTMATNSAAWVGVPPVALQVAVFCPLNAPMSLTARIVSLEDSTLV